MPVIESSNAPVTILYTDIGRGHPNYLDSVLRYMKKTHPDYSKRFRVSSVFEYARGLSLWGWRMVDRVYRAGSRGGIRTRLYGRFRSSRSEYDPDSKLIKLLSRDLREQLQGYKGICLVAHPLLARMLQDRHRVFYVHGEIAVPAESGVIGAERVYVPLREAREKMLAWGVPADALVETGLILEPELCGELRAVVRQRRERIMSDRPLTIGFFISGAYPRSHVDLMVRGAQSCLSAGLKVRFFWGCDRRQVQRLVSTVREFADDFAIDEATGAVHADARLVIITAQTREAETIRSMEYLPGLDVFCAAPHERVNWSVGAGLPMIMIGPPIGTFAPENRAFVLRIGSGCESGSLDDFSKLGPAIHRARQNGHLLKMAEAGQRVGSVHGAKVTAEDLLARID